MKAIWITVITVIIIFILPLQVLTQEPVLPETETEPVLAWIELDTVSTGNYFSPAISSESITRFDSLEVWIIIDHSGQRMDSRLLYTLRNFDFFGLTRTLIDDNWMERNSDGICRLQHDNGKIVFAGLLPEGVYGVQLRVRGFNPDMTAFSTIVPFRNFMIQKK